MNVLPVLLLLHIALTDKARQEGRYQRIDFVLGAGALLMIAVGLTSKAIWMTNACEIGMSFICLQSAIKMCYPDKTFMRSRMCSAILMAVCAGMMAVCFADAFKANNSFCAEPSLSGKVTQSNMERISGGDVPMSDPGKRVKTVCDCMFGAGSFEKANVEKMETDSAYCFALTFPGGTNCTIRVMKKDGKVICDKAPKASEERLNDV